MIGDSLSPAGATDLNRGVMEATAGGGLVLGGLSGNPLTLICALDSGDPAPGIFEAVGAGSYVSLENVILVGGKLATSGGGLIETEGTDVSLGGYDTGIGMIGVNNTGFVLVNDGTTVSVAATLNNTGTISVASTGGSTEIRLETEADFNPGFKDTSGTRYIYLAGDGAITLSDNANNLIAATRTTDILDNEGNTISGAGAIGGGSAMGLMNDGTIDATGTNALVVNLATGKITNQIHGTMEATGAGGLSLSGGTFTNTGTFAALDGSSATIGPGVTLTNDSGGTLTGGTWEATDGGHGATLTIAAGPAVATDAATVILSGANSLFDTDGMALEQSLATIAAKGKLELLAGRSWSGALGLTDDGLLQLGGGSLAPASLTVPSGGTVEGFGTIAAALTNNGLVEASGGTLTLSGALSGTGTIEIAANGSTAEIGGATPSTQTVLFGKPIHETLKLDDPSGFAGTISHWGLADTIDLAKTDAVSATITGDTLAIGLSGGGTLDYKLANPPTGMRIVLSSDNAGGTDLTLARQKAALLGEAVAAWAPAGGTGPVVPGGLTADAAPLLAGSHR